MHSLLTFCIVLMTWAFTNGEIEKVVQNPHSPIDVDHYADGEHNVDFDHEAILGPDREYFENLPPDIAKEKLQLLAAKIDTNHDAYVQEDELTQWILNTFRLLDEHDALGKFKEQDLNGDAHVDWSEVVQKVYGYKMEELNKFMKDESEEMKLFIQMVEWDKKKFDAADQDKNELLDVDEFAAFLHPQNYGHMYDVETQRVLDDHDKNKDGFIDFQEFLGDSPSDKEHEIYEKEQFESYDTNSDGKLQGNEIQDWVLPDQHMMAEDETKHLFSETDKNGDKKLSFIEIIDQYKLWVGSQATDYGHQLHDPAEL